MTQEAKTVQAPRKKSTAPTQKSGAHAAASTTGPAYQHYQSALQLLQQNRFDKALVALEKLLPEAPPELKERCKMYIAACQRQLEANKLAFETPEEHYDYAISMLNTGYYEEAREQFHIILSEHPDSDYVFYGLAVLDAITGNTQDCLQNLERSISLNARNRLQARIDNDFQSMVDDPRFTELLYPEIP